MGKGVPSPEVRRSGHEGDYSSPSSSEVNVNGATTSTPPYVFMACTRPALTFYKEVYVGQILCSIAFL